MEFIAGDIIEFEWETNMYRAVVLSVEGKVVSVQHMDPKYCKSIRKYNVFAMSKAPNWVVIESELTKDNIKQFKDLQLNDRFFFHQ